MDMKQIDFSLHFYALHIGMLMQHVFRVSNWFQMMPGRIFFNFFFCRLLFQSIYSLCWIKSVNYTTLYTMVSIQVFTENKNTWMICLLFPVCNFKSEFEEKTKTRKAMWKKKRVEQFENRTRRIWISYYFHRNANTFRNTQKSFEV